jgi:hypothetical protein
MQGGQYCWLDDFPGEWYSSAQYVREHAYHHRYYFPYYPEKFAGAVERGWSRNIADGS